MSFIRPKALWPRTRTTVPMLFTGRRWRAIQTLSRLLRVSRAIGYRGTGRVSLLAPTELEEVKSIIDRTLTLAPKSPEAHFALGLLFYWGHRQYEKALAEFNRTLELQPNNALARQFCGSVYRR